LTKANSIEGNKKDNITVIYTPWSNLKKTAGMETGQVGFHKQKMVKKIHVEQRINEIVNRLNKTKVEKNPDFAQDKSDYEKEKKRRERALEKKKWEEEERIAKETKERAHQEKYAYEALFSADNIRHSSNADRGDDDEDDFM